MAASYGRGDLILRHAGDLTTDRHGLVSGSCRYQFPKDAWEMVPGFGLEHPYASFCHLEKKRVVFTRGLWTVNAWFVGCETEASEKIYSLRRNTQREPIETHPDFVAEIGGKPSDRKNGAIFLDETGHPTSDDKLGIFDRFRILDNAGVKNKYAGVDAYLAPTNTVWKAKWTSRAKPEQGSGVGKIDANPTGGPPDYGEGFEWLYTGMGYESRGKVWSCDEEWLLGAWIEGMYAE